MPGTFFWKNKGFEEHAREIGLANNPSVGIVPEHHLGKADAGRNACLVELLNDPVSGNHKPKMRYAGLLVRTDSAFPKFAYNIRWQVLAKHI